jgi:UDP-N-acetylmuramoylalanine--D-glutamate ligase
VGGRQLTGLPLDALRRHDDWSGVHAVVAGFGLHGAAAADNLLFIGARVTVLSETPVHGYDAERATLLTELGAKITLGPGSTAELPEVCDVLVAGPQWREHEGLVAQAEARGIPVWSELELAWRLREAGAQGRYAPWLVIAGEDGRTTVVDLVISIMNTVGLYAAVIGEGPRSAVETIMDPSMHDLVIVDAHARDLHFTHSMAPESTAIVFLPPRVGTEDPMVLDQGSAYERVSNACIYNVEEPVQRELVERAEVAEGARGIGFTLGMPSVGMVGMVEDILVDRAFIPERSTSAAEICTLADLNDPTPFELGCALAAAALARSVGVPQHAVRTGLINHFSDDV